MQRAETSALLVCVNIKVCVPLKLVKRITDANRGDSAYESQPGPTGNGRHEEGAGMEEGRGIGSGTRHRYVVARFVVQLGVADWKAAVQLGVWLWIGFVFMILVGAVVWDNVSWKLTAIHAGDWLVKLPLMAVILAVWRK